MKQIGIVLLIPFFLSCHSSKNTNNSISEEKISAEPQQEEFYDDNADYNSILTYQYNEDDQIIIESFLSPYERGIYLDTMISSTKYYYDERGNLIKKLPYNNSRYSKSTFFQYNSSDQLIKKLTIDHKGDTTELVFKEYDKDTEFNYIKTFKYKKDKILLARNKQNVPFDTSITLEKNKYKDSLLLATYKYSIVKDSLIPNMEFYYDYNANNKLIQRTVLNSNGDTSSWETNTYRNGILVKDSLYFVAPKLLQVEYFDKKGYPEKTIIFNKETGKSDTLNMVCDDRGNVIKVIGY